MTRDYMSLDLTYKTANPAIWSCVEASIAITSICLPSLWLIVAAIETTSSKLRTRYPKSRSSSSRRTESSRVQPKSAVGAPGIPEGSVETSDTAKLHDTLHMHHMTDLSTNPEISAARSDDGSISQSGLPQNWDHPCPLKGRKGADHV